MRRGRAALGRGGEHARNEVVERRGNQGHELRKARSFGGDQARQGGDGGRADVWRAPGDQLEERCSQRVDIGSRIDRALAAGLLGRHVGGGADDGAGAREPHVFFEGNAEVDQLGERPLGVGGMSHEKILDGLMSR